MTASESWNTSFFFFGGGRGGTFMSYQMIKHLVCFIPAVFWKFDNLERTKKGKKKAKPDTVG